MFAADNTFAKGIRKLSEKNNNTFINQIDLKLKISDQVNLS